MYLFQTHKLKLSYGSPIIILYYIRDPDSRSDSTFIVYHGSLFFVVVDSYEDGYWVLGIRIYMVDTAYGYGMAEFDLKLTVTYSKLTTTTHIIYQ